MKREIIYLTNYLILKDFNLIFNLILKEDFIIENNHMSILFYFNRKLTKSQANAEADGNV